ncbi:MAG: DUF799 family lipoprotein [Planctomycetes bacterium]|nr:DUF799 family lipoprotein [Planctomycetota bacterium]MBI3846039.1 DUF799 family lipoprotein [Planctomycetota bacterium]
MSRALALALVLATIVFSGCSSTLQVKRSSHYDDQAPIRVAILPFEDESGGTFFSVLAWPFKQIADLFVSHTGAPPTEPATALREAIAANLRVTNIDLVDLRFVDTALGHNGLHPKVGGAFRKTSPKALGQLLGADALLYGSVTTYRADFFLAESRVTIGADLKLVDAYTGEELWQATGDESLSFGISKGPTGYTSAVVEPVKGLRESNLWDVSAEFARNIGSALRGRAETESGDVGPAPFVSVAATSVELNTKVAPGDVVRVVALGTPHARASFDIGNVRRGIPMTEFGEGTYQGTYTVLDGDRFAKDPIVVVFRNGQGRASMVPIMHAPLVSADR